MGYKRLNTWTRVPMCVISGSTEPTPARKDGTFTTALWAGDNRVQRANVRCGKQNVALCETGKGNKEC